MATPMPGPAGAASRVVLHVGAPKVGSTALQRALGAADWREGERPFAYARWDRDGSVDMTPAPHPLTGYAYSEFTLSSLATATVADVDRFARALGSSRTRVVLSNEGWQSEVGGLIAEPGFRSRCRALFGEEGLAAQAVLYVRPQTAWVESFYLQFAIWSGVDVDGCALGLQGAREGYWAARADALREAGFDVVVRFTPDVATDFLVEVMGVPATDPRLAPVVSANRRVSLDLLVLMLAHRSLRPDQHAPHVEFLVERLGAQWGLAHREVPPLVGEELDERIVAAYADDNRRLAELLPPDQWAAYERGIIESTRSRRGTPTVTREQLAATPVLPDYLDALLAHSLDEVMRARFGIGIPGVEPTAEIGEGGPVDASGGSRLRRRRRA